MIHIVDVIFISKNVVNDEIDEKSSDLKNCFAFASRGDTRCKMTVKFIIKITNERTSFMNKCIQNF